MKKLFITAAFLLAAGTGFCAERYQSIGSVEITSATFSGGFTPMARTVAQLQTLTAKTSGQVLVCINCNIPYSLVVSSGNTAPYQWQLSTGTAAK